MRCRLRQAFSDRSKLACSGRRPNESSVTKMAEPDGRREGGIEMRSIVGCLTTYILCVFVFCPGNMFRGDLLFSEGTSPAPCAAPAYHQFDYWVGDWDVFDVGRPTKVAQAQVDSVLDGCVLRENYLGIDGHKGQSFTMYNGSRKTWHQTWVTNRGELLEIEGGIENGEMVLLGKNQAGALVRGVWRPVNEEVREIAMTSADGGKSWKPWFDLVFRRHKL